MGVFGATSWAVRPDVRAVAQTVSRKFGCSWNTYIDHPPGLGLDAVSVDFWGPGGRGDNLPPEKRRQIANYLKERTGFPRWRWIINGNHGQYADGTRFTPPGGPLWNRGHVHITFS